MITKFKNLFKSKHLKQNWFGFFIEFIIVVFGISIAFQLNVEKLEQDKTTIEKYLISNLKTENQINLGEFSSLTSFRQNSETDVKALLNLVISNELQLNKIEVEKKILNVFNIREEPIQTAFLEAYLNNYTTDYTLNVELLKLKSIFQDLIAHRARYYSWKKEHLWEYLIEDIDLVSGKIIDFKKIHTTHFKNVLMLLLALEKGQKDFHDLAIEQMNIINKKVK